MTYALLPLRLSGFYIAIFFVTGSMLPFWPVWLAAQGLSSSEIGILNALPVIGKVIFSPFFAGIGDKTGERKRLMLLLCIGGLLAFSAFHWVDGFAAYFIVSLIYGLFWSSLMSFGDNIALLSTHNTPIQYGRLRLWGSLSFVFMASGLGVLLDNQDESLIYWVILSAIFVTFLSITTLPNVRVAPTDRASRPLKNLFQRPGFIAFLISVACIHGSHALYYGFATLHWRSLGYSDVHIGLLWAEGVIIEVIFFIFGGRIGQFFSPAKLLLLASLACMVRWGVFAADPPLELLYMVQPLHALTFGAMHLGAMNHIKQAIPISLSASAQSLYGAASMGLGTGVIMLGSGYFYYNFGAQAFLIMTLIGLFGTISSLVLKKTEHT